VVRGRAQIILHSDIHLNAQQGYGWIGRTHILMQEGSKLIVGGCIFMRHGALIKLSKDAVLEFAGNVSANINLTIGIFNKKDGSILKTNYYNFEPNVLSTAKNFIEQGYEYLKTLDGFKDAIDLLDEGQMV
jgi:hypothetical protein